MDGKKVRMGVGRTQDLVRFEVGDAGTFVIRPAEGLLEFFENELADPMRVEHLVVHSTLAMLCGLRGTVCLHASAVGKKGQALLLAGPSGVGKSTQAFKLVKDGWDFVADDLAVLDEGPRGWRVHPGAGTIRLYGETLPEGWNNRGKTEALMPTVDLPMEVAEVTLLTSSAVGAITQAEMHRSLLALQAGWMWADEKSRYQLADAIWELASKVKISHFDRAELWV